MLSISFRSLLRFSDTQEAREMPPLPLSYTESVGKHDLHQQSFGCGWSFEKSDEVGIMENRVRERPSSIESDGTSSHLSLTNITLLRLVKESEAAAYNITTKQSLVPARTSSMPTLRGLPLHNLASGSSLTADVKISSLCALYSEQSESTSLLDLYLLNSSSCLNAGSDSTHPSTATMNGQSSNIKGVRHASVSTTLSVLEGIFDAYAASEHSDRSDAFIHAEDLDRQSYINARLENASRSAPLFRPGPPPSVAPPLPVYRPARFFAALEESELTVPTPPTRILDRARKPDLWGAVDREFSSCLNAESSPSRSKVDFPSDHIITPYKSFVQLGKSPVNDDTPLQSASIRTHPSTVSMAPTIPIEVSGYDDDRELILERQVNAPPRQIKHGISQNLPNDTIWMQREQQGRRLAWAFFVLLASFPFLIVLYSVGAFDKVLIYLGTTHARPTRLQKRAAMICSALGFVVWPTLAA